MIIELYLAAVKPTIAQINVVVGSFVDVVVVVVFTAPCYSNGAVLPSYDVRPSVRDVGER